MIKTVKILLYPCGEEFLNVLELNTFRTEYIVVSLVSPKGWKEVGRKVHLGENVLEVKDDFFDELHKCDTVWIINSRLEINNSIIEKYEKFALENNKKVFNLRNNAIPDDNNWKVDKALIQELESEVFSELDVPIIMIANVFGDNYFENLKVHSYIKKYIEKKGYSVLSIALEIESELFGWHTYFEILEGNIDELSIERLNGYVNFLYGKENADVIIVNVPGNLIRYGSLFLGDCGVSAYKFSRALLPDAIVMGLTYGNYNKEYMESLNYELECILGQEVDFFVMQNREIDIEETMQLSRLQTIKVNPDLVLNNISALEMKNMYYSEQRALQILTEKIVEKLKSYSTVSLI